MIIQKAEQLTQILERRFKSSVDDSCSNRLPSEMRMDLLMVFHDEQNFDFETFRKYNAENVLDYLEATHRYYLAEVLPKINYAIEGLSKSRENLSGLKLVLERVFAHLEEDLVKHMAEEEQELFPYVRKLSNGIIMDRLDDKSLLDQFIHEHDDNCETILGELIGLLNNKIQDFPNYFSLTMLRQHLEFFRRDLIVHSLLEEKVLVPMAVEMESNLKM